MDRRRRRRNNLLALYSDITGDAPQNAPVMTMVITPNSANAGDNGATFTNTATLTMATYLGSVNGHHMWRTQDLTSPVGDPWYGMFWWKESSGEYRFWFGSTAIKKRDEAIAAGTPEANIASGPLLDDMTYDIAFFVDGVEVESHDALRHSRYRGISFKNWGSATWRTPAEIRALNVLPEMDLQAVQSFAFEDFNPPSPVTYEPLQVNGLTKHMAGVGGRSEQFFTYTMSDILNGRDVAESQARMVGQAESMATWPWYLTAPGEVTPIRVDDSRFAPFQFWRSDDLPAAQYVPMDKGGHGANAWTWIDYLPDHDHLQTIQRMAYLLTGDPYFLWLDGFVTNWFCVAQSPENRADGRDVYKFATPLPHGVLPYNEEGRSFAIGLEQINSHAALLDANAEFAASPLAINSPYLTRIEEDVRHVVTQNQRECWTQWGLMPLTFQPNNQNYWGSWMPWLVWGSMAETYSRDPDSRSWLGPEITRIKNLILAGYQAIGWHVGARSLVVVRSDSELFDAAPPVTSTIRYAQDWLEFIDLNALENYTFLNMDNLPGAHPVRPFGRVNYETWRNLGRLAQMIKTGLCDDLIPLYEDLWAQACDVRGNPVNPAERGYEYDDGIVLTGPAHQVQLLSVQTYGYGIAADYTVPNGADTLYVLLMAEDAIHGAALDAGPMTPVQALTVGSGDQQRETLLLRYDDPPAGAQIITRAADSAAAAMVWCVSGNAQDAEVVHAVAHGGFKGHVSTEALPRFDGSRVIDLLINADTDTRNDFEPAPGMEPIASFAQGEANIEMASRTLRHNRRWPVSWVDANRDFARMAQLGLTLAPAAKAVTSDGQVHTRAIANGPYAGVVDAVCDGNYLTVAVFDHDATGTGDTTAVAYGDQAMTLLGKVTAPAGSGGAGQNALSVWGLASPAAARAGLAITSASDSTAYEVSSHQNVDVGTPVEDLRINGNTTGTDIDIGPYTNSSQLATHLSYVMADDASAALDQPDGYLPHGRLTLGSAAAVQGARSQLGDILQRTPVWTQSAPGARNLRIDLSLKPVTRGGAVTGTATGIGNLAPAATQAPQSAPVLTDEQQTTAKSFAVSWTHSAADTDAPTSFLIEVDTDVNFASPETFTVPAFAEWRAVWADRAGETDYYIGVTAVNSQGNSPRGTVQITTPFQPVAPVAPGVTVDAVSHQDAVLTLTDPNSGTAQEDGIRVEIFENHIFTGAPVDTQIFAADSTEITVALAKDDQDYGLRVTAYNSTGDASSDVTITTLEAPPAPVAPTITSWEIRASTASLNAWDARWSYSPGDEPVSGDEQILEISVFSNFSQLKYDLSYGPDQRGPRGNFVEKTADAVYARIRLRREGFPDAISAVAVGNQ